MTKTRASQPDDDARRAVLKCFGLAGLVGAGFSLGFARPARASNVPGWPADAFKQKSKTDALESLYEEQAQKSDQVKLDVPEIAENGAVVPVSFSTSLPDVTSMALLVAQNPFTLACAYKTPKGTEPAVSCRVKMAKTSDVIAVVESGGKLYSTTKNVKVTLGGCGG